MSVFCKIKTKVIIWNIDCLIFLLWFSAVHLKHTQTKNGHNIVAKKNQPTGFYCFESSFILLLKQN